MELTPYLDSVAADTAKAVALADEATQQVASRLVTVLEPSLRLAMVRLLSDAAAQLTADLDGTVVAVRMDGSDPAWQVTPAAPAAPQADTDDEDATARVTVRLPEGLKRRIEAQAQASGQSVNTWIVQALRDGRPPVPTHHHTGRRVTGWA